MTQLRSLFLFVFMSSLCMGAIGQSKTELLREAKLAIAHKKEKEAIPKLEQLYELDDDNPNVAYMLGMCYILEKRKVDKAIELLSSAKPHFSSNYNPTSLTERNVSEYVYYYLIIGYSLKGDCEKTLETLNQFYRIYSYEDEWYLVDGQKWHRECGTFDLKDETEEEELMATKTAEDGTAQSVVDSAEVTRAEPKVALNEVSKSEGNRVPVKERLIPVEKHDHELLTRDVSSSANVSLYGVQVGAFIEPKFIRQFDNLKNVEAYVDRNGVFRYVIGRLPYLSQAQKLLAYVKDVGYTDAFIVDINRGNPKYEEEVISIDEQNIQRKLVGNVQYRVQVGAFREEVPEEMLKAYLTVDQLREYIQGDLTILTIGNYKSYDIAKAYCQEVRSTHVPDAFVVAFNQGFKIPLDEALKYQELKEEEKERASQKKRRGFWFFGRKNR